MYGTWSYRALWDHLRSGHIYRKRDGRGLNPGNFETWNPSGKGGLSSKETEKEPPIKSGEDHQMLLAPCKHRQDSFRKKKERLSREGISWDEDPEGPGPADRANGQPHAEWATLTEIQKRAEQLRSLPSSDSSRPWSTSPAGRQPDGHRDSGPAVTLLGQVQRSRTHTPAINRPPQDHTAGPSTPSPALGSRGSGLQTRTRGKEKGATADHYRQSLNRKGRERAREKWRQELQSSQGTLKPVAGNPQLSLTTLNVSVLNTLV